MSTPSDDLPTTVIPQQTVEQPAVTTAPATRRARVWQRKLPPRIGRARTSTVIIGCLFVLLGGLNFALPQEDPFVTVPTSDGGTVRVRESQYTPAPTVPSTTAPAPGTSQEPAPTTTATSTRPRTTAPSTTPAEEEDEEPTTTAPSTTRATTGPSTTSSSRATTSRAPSTTAAPEETAEEQTPAGSASPTG